MRAGGKRGKGRKNFYVYVELCRNPIQLVNKKKNPPKKLNQQNSTNPKPRPPDFFPYSIQITALNLALPLFICSSASPA